MCLGYLDGSRSVPHSVWGGIMAADEPFPHVADLGQIGRLWLAECVASNGTTTL